MLEVLESSFTTEAQRTQRQHRGLQCASRVGDDNKRGSSIQDARQRATQVLRIERCETLIQHHKVCLLQYCARDVEPASFTMRQLPTCLTDHLLQSGRHAINQVAETKFAALARESGFKVSFKVPPGPPKPNGSGTRGSEVA